jgi:polygalacturonase
MKQEFRTSAHGIDPSGKALVTKELQELIDKAGNVRGKVVIEPGVYLSGSLFLRSGVEFHLEKGAILLGSKDGADYPLMWTRAAGIETEWMPALLNAIDCDDIAITGPGMLDGQGEVWWDKFWGPDRLGGMCRKYKEKGLRWAVDYDCMRPRMIQILNCNNVICRDFHLTRSGFWNLHLCYCTNALVSGVRIDNCQGPSTDGIDIDSCDGVVVENCDISCNDDNIVLKAGMNADGLRVDRVCQNVEIRNCVLREGMGLSFGSDMAGGIRAIRASDITMIGTDRGVSLKSAKVRGGFVEDVIIENIRMRNVGYAISLNANWFPDFSYPKIPDEYEGNVPKLWQILTQPVPEGKGMPQIRSMTIRGLTSTFDEDYEGRSRAFLIQCYDDNPMRGITIADANITAKEFGAIHQVQGMKLENTVINIRQ